MKTTAKKTATSIPVTAIVPEMQFTLESPPAGGYIQRTELGITFDDKTPMDVWQEEGRHLAQETKVSAFRLADWFIFGERAFPKNYKSAMAATGLAYKTLRNMAVVARRFPIEARFPALSFEHHRLLAPVSEEVKLAEIAKKATEEKLSAAAMRHIVPRVEPTPKTPKPMSEKQKIARDKKHRDGAQTVLKYLADMPPEFLINWQTVCSEMLEIAEAIVATKGKFKKPAKDQKVAAKKKK